MNNRNLWLILMVLCGFGGCQQQAVETDPGPEIFLPPDFEATLIYRPSDHQQGSWVSLTSDPQGRLIASDQYGYLYRITPPQKKQPLKVEKIPLELGQAQGLLWAFNSLYVSVNTYDTTGGKTSGLYRLTDTDHDDQLDAVQTLMTFEGAGEHGPHSIVLGPEGNYIYLIAGNHTDVPASFGSVLPAVWQQDRLFPAVKDPRGHANDRDAPGGWIARTDSLGKSWQIVASGFRNAYDLAFDENGELFTYDSDMEWDLGTPWYRPTRICHVIPGAEYGWRTGSAKWPSYYADNLGEVLPLGQGSPTGITFGKGAHFPEKYQRGLFALDWSFGTIYFLDLSFQGASYKAEKEEFLSGTPLPVTDIVIAPDGAMYFTTGGRRVASSLYKVTYKGNQPTDPVSSRSEDPLHNLRRSLQDLQTAQPEAVEKLWAYLKHSDRYIRYTARVALENQPMDSWLPFMQKEVNPDAVLQSTIALARVGGEQHRGEMINALSKLKVAQLTPSQQLDLVRAYGLVFIRWGLPKNLQKVSLPEFPSGDAALDRELCELLTFLKHPQVVAKTVALMEETDQPTLEAELIDKEVLGRSDQYGPVIAAMHDNRPSEQSLAYALALSNATTGWTTDLRVRYFKWFYRSLSRDGGESYRGFVERIRLKALDQVPARERAELAELSGEALLIAPAGLKTGITPPQGPGRQWEVGEANELISKNLTNRSFQHGEQMYQALMCSSCHTMKGQGGTAGPDLTQLSSRFSTWDVLQSIQTPSLTISDQYGATIYSLQDGSSLIGRTISSTEDSLYINVNPYDASSTRAIHRRQVQSQQNSPVSWMPAGLINQLNEQELLDLMAYLNSGGDPDHEVFQPLE